MRAVVVTTSTGATDTISTLPPETPTRPVIRDDAAATPVPSARPTSVAELGVSSAIDQLSGLRQQGNCGTPVSIAVPVRWPNADTSALGHRKLFILLHVDGVSSIAEISMRSGLPKAEVIAVFLDLVSTGIVTLEGPPGTQLHCPVSGVFDRFTLDDE
jgi:hypothetical protein